MMKDVFLPMPLLKFLYNYPGLFQMGYFAAFVCLLVIIYKIRTSRANNTFREYLLYVFYASAFRCGLNAFLYHPYYSNLFSAMLELPVLAALLNLTYFVVRRYGIGGEE